MTIFYWIFLEGWLGFGEKFYYEGTSVSKCREAENMFLCPSRKKLVICKLFPKFWTDFKGLYSCIPLSGAQTTGKVTHY